MIAGSKVLSIIEDQMFKTRGAISRYLLTPGVAIREPEWNLELIQDICDQSFVMEMITRTLCQEVARPGLEIKARFVHKCAKCGNEYQSETKECQECHGTEFRSPASNERKILEEILRHPNSTDDWDRIVRSMVENDLKVGNWWLSITYQDIIDPETKKVEKRVAELFVEDPRWIRILADEKGRIRSDLYFCPKCYKKDIHYTLKPEEIESGIAPTCPTCDGPLTMTAYLQEVHGEITSRWGLDEMVHGSSTQRLPELYGRPRPLSVWKWLIMLRMMIDYNTEIYSTGYVSGFLVFQGLDQDHVNAIKAQIEKDIEAKQIIDPVTGETRPSLRVRQAWIGTGALGEKPLAAEFIESMPDPAQMQSLDWFKFGIEKVTSVFGVTPVFVSIIESGRAGNNPRMQIDVQNRTIQELQRSIVSALNKQLLDRLKIRDWELGFRDIELRDELRQVQIHEIRARAAERWLAAGFNVKIDPNTGDIIVSGEGKPPTEAPPEARGVPGPHISEESGDVLEKRRFFSKAVEDRILAIGTKGEIEEESEEHRLQSALTILKGSNALRLDAGAPLTDVEKRFQDAMWTFISHAHPDHVRFANTYSGRFFGGPGIQDAIRKRLGEQFYDAIGGGVKEYGPWRWFDVGPFRAKLYPTLHSKGKITPSYALKIETKDEIILYLSDFIGFRGAGRQAEALEDVDVIILDGSSVRREIVRRDQETGEIYGHASLERQIRMASRAGIRHALVTHLGANLVMNPERTEYALARIGSDHGVDVEILRDGMSIQLEEFREVEKAEPLWAIYLVEPHGRLIWEMKKTVTVKSRRYESHENEPLLLVEDGYAYGTIILRNPREITWQQFDELQPKHRISREEAERWGWTKYEKLWAYDIEVQDRFTEPIYVKVPQGVQTFVEVRHLRFYDSLEKAKATIPGGPEHTEPQWTRLAIKQERGLARKLRQILLCYRDEEISREEALKLGEETITKHRSVLEKIALTKYNQMLRRMLPARERRGFESLKELPPEALRRITAILEGALADFRSILGDVRTQA
jgi:hypothetical protein